jgi:hypothetical protein
VKGEGASDNAKRSYGAQKRRMGRRQLQTCEQAPIASASTRATSADQTSDVIWGIWTKPATMIQLKVRIPMVRRLQNSHSCSTI